MSFYDKKPCPPIVDAEYDTFPVSEANCVGMRMIFNPEAHLSQKMPTMEEVKAGAELELAQVRDIANVFDEVYATRSGEDLYVRWAIPKHPSRKGKLPIMAYVEGSGWGDQFMWISSGKHEDLLRAGWAIASIKHRSAMRAPFPAHLQDAKTGLRFIKYRADAHGLDGSRIVLWGCSSGGHTVSLMAVTQDVPELDTPDYGEYDLKVAGVIDCFGPTALHLMNTEPRASTGGKSLTQAGPPAHLFGGIPMDTDCPEVRRAEPQTYIVPGKDFPPLLILHGNKDMTVPFGQSVMFYEALVQAGYEADFYCVDRAGHEKNGFWSKPTLDVILDYSEKWIKGV